MDQFEKALACKTLAPLRHELFEKGKRAEIGEVREWKGQKVRKTANGWVPVTDGKQKSNQEEPSTETKEQPKDLATLARSASDAALKVAAQGPNEEVRIAAKKELERRKSEGSDVFEAPKGEETPQSEPPKDKVSKPETSKKKTSKTKSDEDSVPSEYDEDAEGLAGWIDDKYDVDEWDPIFLELRDSGAILEGDLDVSYRNSSETQVVNSIFENHFKSYTDLEEQDIKNILRGMVQYYSSESGGKKTFEKEEKPSKSKKSKLDPTSKKGVEEFLKANFYTEDTYRRKYKHTIKEDPKTGRIVVSGIFRCKEDIKSLNNNGAFDWGEVSYFYCDGCTSLTSLEGAPKKVGGSFSCNGCTSLTSLEGAPKEVKTSFDCRDCTSLTSLTGAPKEVKGSFDCRGCTSLTSLTGAPKKVGGSFTCSDCTSLTSLEGAPEEIHWDFYCDGCTSLTSLEGAPEEVEGRFVCRNVGRTFKPSEIEKICNVGDSIYL